MPHDTSRRWCWSMLSDVLWLIAKALGVLAWLPMVLAEAAAAGSARAHFRSLPDPIVRPWIEGR